MPQSKTVPPLRTITEIKANTFIFAKRRALSPDLCETMIERFERQSEEHYEGRLGQTANTDRSVVSSHSR